MNITMNTNYTSGNRCKYSVYFSESIRECKYKKHCPDKMPFGLNWHACLKYDNHQNLSASSNKTIDSLVKGK